MASGRGVWWWSDVAGARVPGAAAGRVMSCDEVFELANCQPWTDYKVRDLWIAGLLQARKLSFAVVEVMFVKTQQNVAYHK
eukprot:1466615-Prorocentrum_lima.AAC.1